jgi:hypothetical protein
MASSVIAQPHANVASMKYLGGGGANRPESADVSVRQLNQGVCSVATTKVSMPRTIRVDIIEVADQSSAVGPTIEELKSADQSSAVGLTIEELFIDLVKGRQRD